MPKGAQARFMACRTVLLRAPADVFCVLADVFDQLGLGLQSLPLDVGERSRIRARIINRYRDVHGTNASSGKSLNHAHLIAVRVARTIEP